ncbi:DUF4411 domain-containing protein [Virgibacillus natechei]|uniref:DUF4411 domain-containing protein n=1 Tax=Virgibacillus sp. CBA3643 TaxID=2942278 RepID=UPI0035A2BDAC
MEIIAEKRYMLDTNVFRYIIDSSSQHKREAKQFWKKILNEVVNREAEIFTTAEVIRELNVQSYAFLDKEKARLKSLKINLTVKPDSSSINAEHLIRMMTAYVRSKYRPDLDVINRGVEYPSVSDSRIILSGWQHKCTMVTSNIKEFMLYPLLFKAEESPTLYNLLTQQYIEIDSNMHDVINNDSEFMKMKIKLEGMYG